MKHALRFDVARAWLLFLFFSVTSFGVTASFGDAPPSSELLSIELNDDGVTFEITRSAECKYADQVGEIREEYFDALWYGLIDRSDIQSLYELEILEEIRQEVKRTGLVGNIDPARTTILTLRYEGTTRTIRLYNVAATRKSYPLAEKLARYDQARLSLRELETKCDIGPSSPGDSES